MSAELAARKAQNIEWLNGRWESLPHEHIVSMAPAGAAVSTAVVRRCLINVSAGTVVGLVLFWAARNVLSSWLYDITPGDPRVLAAAIAVLAAVALLASWIPARRAAHIDPATALRLD